MSSTAHGARSGKAAATGSAGAGPRGGDVRSDLHAAVELRESGGIEVQVESKVGTLYGVSIHQTVEQVLTGLGIEHCGVHVEDRGALPWVIAARVEAACRRAGRGQLGDARPEATVHRRSTARGRLRRSRLYLPGSQPKFMLNAGIHRPDAVILDLEDSVHPDDKDAARLLVRNALRSVDFMGAERMVRINQLPLGLEDLEEVIPESPDVILVPKVEDADQVRDVFERISDILGADDESASGTSPAHGKDGQSVWLLPILESALGVENAFEIVRAAPTVVALTIGLEDYTADLGVRKTKEGNESLYARGRLVNAARAARVQAIDSVYGDVDDIEGLLEWGRRSHALGFEGMGCIHPRQIRPIHQAFAPTPDEIERAQKIVAAFEEAEARGLGVVSLGTRMVDPPVVKRALGLIDHARRAGLLPAGEDDRRDRQ